jgi:hypothetical protein
MCFSMKSPWSLHWSIDAISLRQVNTLPTNAIFHVALLHIAVHSIWLPWARAHVLFKAKGMRDAAECAGALLVAMPIL